MNLHHWLCHSSQQIMQVPLYWHFSNDFHHTYVTDTSGFIFTMICAPPFWGSSGLNPWCNSFIYATPGRLLNSFKDISWHCTAVLFCSAKQPQQGLLSWWIFHIRCLQISSISSKAELRDSLSIKLLHWSCHSLGQQPTCWYCSKSLPG